MSVALGVVFLTAIGLVMLADGPGASGGRSRAAEVGRRGRQAGIALALAAAGVALHLARGAPWVVVALDWLPGVYLLAGYWLPAQLPRRPAPGLQARLEAADGRLFEAGLARLLDRSPRLLLEYLEAAYLCCYGIVPAGLAWLYCAGHQDQADAFWTAVLLAALPCYTLVAWFETRPPRSVERVPLVCPRGLVMRRLNLAVLDRASIGLNTFPSGHAAASFAAALAVGAVMPAAGAALGVAALSIALGSVAGRYHYALDSAYGALVAVAAFAVSRLV